MAIVWLNLSNREDSRHFEKLCKDREGVDIGTFARSFERRTVDTWIIRAAWEEIREYCPNFPIKSEDRFTEDLRICDEDIEFALLEPIASRTGRSLKKCKNNPYAQEIYTVKDLVLFLNGQPKIVI